MLWGRRRKVNLFIEKNIIINELGFHITRMAVDVDVALGERTIRDQ